MLPPVPIDTLNANPQFKQLYNILITKYIDPTDGSTRPTPEEAEKDAALEQDLRAHRADLARQQILTATLLDLPSLTVPLNSTTNPTGPSSLPSAPTTFTPPGLGLPDETLDTVTLAMAAHLSPPTTHTLLTSSSPAALPVASQIQQSIEEDFRSVADSVSAAVGWYLAYSARRLVEIVDLTGDLPPSGGGGGSEGGGTGTETNTTTITGPGQTSQQAQPHPQPDIDLLPAYAAHRRHLHTHHRSTLITTYTHLTSLTHRHITTSSTRLTALLSYLTTTLPLLERALLAHTDCLLFVLHGISGKLRVLHGQARKAVYPPEAVDALGNYSHHLMDTKVRLVARQRMVEEELRRYERNAGGGGGELAALVRRYAEALGRMEGVSKEIRRLGG